LRTSDENNNAKRIAIIGGGPIGIEAALYGAIAGFDVCLFERGNIASNVRRWGFVQVFTEWGRNRSPLAAKLLADHGEVLPPGDTYSSGDELVQYVEKLAALPPLQGRIHTQTEALSLTRERCLKSDFLDDDGLHGRSRRAEFPFRLHLAGRDGVERIEHFSTIIDATGVYHSPNVMGNGGAPCPGEKKCAAFIDYALPDVVGKDRARFAGKHTLVVGSGHSAASTLLAIADLMEEHPTTRLTWAVRRDVPQHGAPYTLVEDDVSATRARIHRRANALVEHPNVTFLPRTVVEAITYANVFQVDLQCDAERKVIQCNNVAAHTGFRADDTLWRELQVHVHPATGAPLKLGIELNAHNARSGVGLSTGYAERQVQEEETQKKARDRWSVLINDPALLDTGETNFYVLGIKSYGRDAGFLMQNGFRQVRDVWKLISGDPNLNLYGDELK
jgi:thioredoxin reductase